MKLNVQVSVAVAADESQVRFVLDLNAGFLFGCIVLMRKIELIKIILSGKKNVHKTVWPHLEPRKQTEYLEDTMCRGIFRIVDI